MGGGKGREQVRPLGLCAFEIRQMVHFDLISVDWRIVISGIFICADKRLANLLACKRDQSCSTVITWLCSVAISLLASELYIAVLLPIIQTLKAFLVAIFAEVC